MEHGTLNSGCLFGKDKFFISCLFNLFGFDMIYYGCTWNFDEIYEVLVDEVSHEIQSIYASKFYEGIGN